MTISGLTKRQSEALTFIRSYQAANGYSPNYEEIKDALGLASKSGVNRLVLELEERGHITFLPGKARSIALVEAA